MAELLFCAAVPTCQILLLVAIGYVFRTDRKPKGGA